MLVSTSAESLQLLRLRLDTPVHDETNSSKPHNATIRYSVHTPDNVLLDGLAGISDGDG